jgi:nitrogen regulatory protein PII
VIDTLGRAAGTGTSDGGKMIVLSLERAVRTRTGEIGEAAL